MNNEQIGYKLKLLRNSRKLTQQQVADKTGINRCVLSNYEIARRVPSLSQIRILADFYGVGLDFFGISPPDEITELLARAKEIFKNDNIEQSKKDDVYKQLMKLYLNVKD